MNKVNNIFIKQLSELIEDYNSTVNWYGNDKTEGFIVIVTRAKALIGKIAGIESQYYKDALELGGASYEFESSVLIKYIRSLKNDLEKGYLKSLSEIISSEIFSDYLDMAEYLLDEGYKDPAAVIIGSTLEEHLRKLCQANGIDLETTNQKGVIVPKKADLLNTELAKSGVYTSAYQKQVIAWFGLRNSAAHGKYTEYSEEQIKLMLQGVRQFMLFTN